MLAVAAARVVRVRSGPAISKLPQAGPTTIPGSSSGLEDFPYPMHTPDAPATPSYWPCLYSSLWGWLSIKAGWMTFEGVPSVC